MAQTDDGVVLYLDPNPGAVYCGRPGCCVSQCYSGTWYVTWSMCLQGGNGSCMYCDTTCY